MKRNMMIFAVVLVGVLAGCDRGVYERDAAEPARPIETGTLTQTETGTPATATTATSLDDSGFDAGASPTATDTTASEAAPVP